MDCNATIPDVLELSGDLLRIFEIIKLNTETVPSLIIYSDSSDAMRNYAYPRRFVAQLQPSEQQVYLITTLSLILTLTDHHDA